MAAIASSPSRHVLAAAAARARARGFGLTRARVCRDACLPPPPQANPVLARKGRVAFAPFVRAGQLVVLNVLLVGGSADERSPAKPFYVHVRRDEWSSTDPVWGCRASSSAGGR